MKNARIYDFAMTAGGSFSLNVEGEQVRIMTSAGAVELVTDSYRIGPIQAGQGQGASPFKRLTINDKSGAANKGTILISSADFIDDRISGEVSVIDGSRSRALAGGAFTAHLFAPATAGTFSGVQLWNPAGSGKNIVIEQIISVCPAYSLGIQLVAVQLAGGIASNTGNKKSGGGLPSALATWVNNSAANITPASTFSLAHGTVCKLVNPYVLTPGYGLNFGAPVLNNDAGAGLEFFEELI